MKKIIFIAIFSISAFSSFAVALVCYPAMSGGGWDCFGSNGSCGGTWSACTCSGCNGGAGSSSGCNKCCCVALAFPPSNNIGSLSIEEGHIILDLPNQEENIDLGALTQLEFDNDKVFQFSVDTVNKKVKFLIYDGNELLSQVTESGSITDKEGAYIEDFYLYW